jgi:hypothetical protein
MIEERYNFLLSLNSLIRKRLSPNQNPNGPKWMNDHKILMVDSLHCLERVHSSDSHENPLSFLSIRCPRITDFDQEIPGLWLTESGPGTLRVAQWRKQIVDGAVVPVAVMTVAVPEAVFTSIHEISNVDE